LAGVRAVDKEILMTTKEAYREKLETRLKEWAARLDRFKAKAQKATADVRTKFKDELESLGTTRAVVQNMLEELGKRSEGAWREMKDRGERARVKVSRAMEKAAAHFK